jgi:ubiquinone/menaquinone biosynthesis C-methylase UbiE
MASKSVHTTLSSSAYLLRVADFYNSIAQDYDYLKLRNRYYHEQLAQLYKFIVPPGKKVLEIGCSTGDLLAALRPARGVGIDISEQMLKYAKRKYPGLRFIQGSAENLPTTNKFDYIVLSGVVGVLEDIQKSFQELHTVATEDSRIIISYYNYFWEPFLRIAAKLGLKISQPEQNWLSHEDLENVLGLADFEVVKSGAYILLPFYVAFVSSFLNKYVARLPLIRSMCFVRYIVARKKPLIKQKEFSVSVVLPARNEEGNIEDAVKNIPRLGKHTQIIFVEDHSTDNTRREIASVYDAYRKHRDIQFFVQDKEYGKAAAVRRGMRHATGDIVIVFDSDLTVDPVDLPKFYAALRDRKAEFVQGSRLVYAMEKDAMRFLNILGNKFFSVAFSFLLDQRIKDTLCGTKALFRRDYRQIEKNRLYFGNDDPFGDFDMLFGASKFNLKILEIPIRYKARAYGKSNIRRLKHGWLLLRMTILAARKIKFF